MGRRQNDAAAIDVEDAVLRRCAAGWPNPTLLGCGTLGALYLLASTTDHFYPETPISSIIWANLVYPMPILGAAIGAYFAGLVRRAGVSRSSADTTRGSGSD